ncbi:MAG: CTP synthase [Lactobacillaceae bacterium]|jgi:CTP synthase|nr:CTP synthase [Lactobacillaceae bacterium]
MTKSEKQTKYIFVTGGVVSSLGKGIVAASLGRLLKNRGLNVAVQKFDPYLNLDAGTMNPYQHGETFVTEDGLETDLDLGHYERFMDIEANKFSNVTAGRIYKEIQDAERRGDYNGATLQSIPHFTDALKNNMKRVAQTTNADIVITEIGGTVGDIEGKLFLEAIRQMKKDVGPNNVFYIHASLIVKLSAAGETKTKPTQQSVEKLREAGIIPDMLVLRTEDPISSSIKEKLSLFTDVPAEAIIESRDAEILYEVPLNLQAQGMDDIILNKLGLSAPQADMKDWRKMIDSIRESERHDEVKITLVGKYTEVPDAYISVKEALKSAGYASNKNVQIKYINSESVNEQNVNELLKDADGVIVPGGFGNRGIEGKIEAIKYARVNDVPFMGVCLGMQLASVEFARNVLGIKDANSFEMDAATSNPVIALMDSQKKITNIGGTLRLGLYPAKIKKGSVAAKIYGDKEQIQERHRHRYEFNTDYKNQFEDAGMVFSGVSPDDNLMEIIEIPKNKFFVAAQYHPEFLSRPNKPEPLYLSFIKHASQK